MVRWNAHTRIALSLCARRQRVPATRSPVNAAHRWMYTDPPGNKTSHPSTSPSLPAPAFFRRRIRSSPRQIPIMVPPELSKLSTCPRISPVAPRCSRWITTDGGIDPASIRGLFGIRSSERLSRDSTWAALGDEGSEDMINSLYCRMTES